MSQQCQDHRITIGMSTLRKSRQLGCYHIHAAGNTGVLCAKWSQTLRQARDQQASPWTSGTGANTALSIGRPNQSGMAPSLLMKVMTLEIIISQITLTSVPKILERYHAPHERQQRSHIGGEVILRFVTCWLFSRSLHYDMFSG